MKGRSVAAAVTASVLMASSSGCFLHSEKLPQKTVHITVDNMTRTSHAVSCTQVQWWLTADISAAPASVKVVLKLDSEKPKAESVNIDNFDGFTGVADAGAGNATVFTPAASTPSRARPKDLSAAIQASRRRHRSKSKWAADQRRQACPGAAAPCGAQSPPECTSTTPYGRR